MRKIYEIVQFLTQSLFPLYILCQPINQRQALLKHSVHLSQPKDFRLSLVKSEWERLRELPSFPQDFENLVESGGACAQRSIVDESQTEEYCTPVQRDS